MHLSLLDFMYPPFCALCGEKNSSVATLCPACLEREVLDTLQWRVESDTFFQHRLSLYEFEKVQQPIYRLKYSGVYHEAKALVGASLFNETVQELLDSVDIITWVPLHWWRQLRRGYNQAEVISRYLGVSKDKRVALLVRKQYTRSQTMLSCENRAHNVAEVFALKKRVNVQGKSVLIIDDVCTTGATARACGEVLKEAGACAVSLMTLAQA